MISKEVKFIGLTNPDIDIVIVDYTNGWDRLDRKKAFFIVLICWAI